MTTLYWLSFCDEDKAAGEKFLGACMVVASDTITAVKIAHAKKINPDGQVMAVALEVTIEELARAAPYLDRLLSAEDAIAFDAHMRDDGEPGKVIAAKDMPRCPGCGRLHFAEQVCEHGNEEISGG